MSHEAHRARIVEDITPGPASLREPVYALLSLRPTNVVTDLRAGDATREDGRWQRSVMAEGPALGVRVGLALTWTTGACGARHEAFPFEQSRSWGHRNEELSPMRPRLAIVMPARPRAGASQPVLPPLMFETLIRLWMEILRADYRKRHQDSYTLPPVSP
jgi:hypothetical protein